MKKILFAAVIIALFAYMVNNSINSALYKDSVYKVTSSRGNCYLHIISGEFEGQTFRIKSIKSAGYDSFQAIGELVSEPVERSMALLKWSRSAKNMEFSILTIHGEVLINEYAGENSGLFKAGLVIFDQFDIGQSQ
ncbi:MAG: hypothetical protein GY839_19605 [candidate division Zixibacteria bacterium]|nr:hypothetical protein [candidate division Zixibacteria bacterium]